MIVRIFTTCKQKSKSQKLILTLTIHEYFQNNFQRILDFFDDIGVVVPF